MKQDKTAEALTATPATNHLPLEGKERCNACMARWRGACFGTLLPSK